MRILTYLLLAAGVLLFAALLVHYGAGAVLAGAAAAGWGLVWVAAYRALPLATNAQGWRVLFDPATRPPFLPLLRLRWIGEAVNSLLPVAQVGGDVVRARLAVRLGVRGAEAGAGTAVDFTLGLVTQLAFTVMGVALLVQVRGEGADARAWFSGLAVAAAVIAALWAAQHLELFGRATRLGRVFLRSPAWEKLAGEAAALDAHVKSLYTRHRATAACAVWRMAGWLLQAGETWLALYFLGAPASLAAAIVLESLTAAVRSGAFAVPGAVGVQEGGFVLLGPLVGVPAETALALALVKRFRELVVGAAGLAAWAAVEGKGLLQTGDED
jgi:putative membrane protein